MMEPPKQHTRDFNAYKRIADYGVIGNSQTVALVGNDGSIDWLCLPYVDSPSVFGALLDSRNGGRFMIAPRAPYDSTAAYLPGTNILTTTFRTPSGRLRLLDFMPAADLAEPPHAGNIQKIFRCLEVTSGDVEVLLQFEPRFDYARVTTELVMLKDSVLARSGSQQLRLMASRGGFRVDGGRAEGVWHLTSGEKVWFLLVYGDESPEALTPDLVAESFEKTKRYWHGWLARSETGQDLDFGPFRGMIERSSLVLKLLQFAPTGAISAAPTTSLPEEIGGERNWDYRFSWIRDASLTVEALFNIGHLSEMESYLRWLEKIFSENGTDLRVMYGLRGETDLSEKELPHLDGYKGSRPVRVGNGAYGQKQLDIYGEVMDAALRLSNYVGKIGLSMWPFFQSVCDTVVESWHEKDSGIWEVRGGPYHFVFSKVMCWVALDRGLIIARRYGFPANLDRWEACREEIRREVLDRGWNEKVKAFVQHYDTDTLDASLLLLPFYGFLPYDDPRMLSTVDAVQKELTEDGFVYRYRTADGLAGGEGTFLVCTFWLVDILVGQNRLEEATILLLRLEKTANDLGLFAEEYDPRWRELLGNFPQAFSHIGYINSVFALCRARKAAGRITVEPTLPETAARKILFMQRLLLNTGEPEGGGSMEGIANELKHLMNVLRGIFFRTAEGRVAYEEMADSSVFRRYVECSRHLQHFDLRLLRSREERMAFWINLFNVMVIHGVIELGIRDSVREVPRFFRRIRYLIGGLEFSADDIEHGILRGNHRFPHSLLHPFGQQDPRRSQLIEPMDPRIHFALVCASSSCPPIEIYSAETLDEDLEVSGKTFLNSGGVRIDCETCTIWLPKVFDWYGEDFGRTEEERLLFIAPYLYRNEDRQYLERNAGRFRVKYDPYDWRLNRT